jgi:hypothetical protein
MDDRLNPRFVFSAQVCRACGAGQECYTHVDAIASDTLQCGTCRRMTARIVGVGLLVTGADCPNLFDTDAWDLIELELEAIARTAGRRRMH